MAYPLLTQKADLTLIISTFEKSMVISEDLNSVFPAFRPHIDKMQGILRGSLTASAMALSTNPSLASSSSLDSDLGSVATDEPVTTQPESSDNTKDEEIEKFLQECIPCDFKKMFKQDWNALKNFQVDMEANFEKVKANFEKLEKMFDDTTQGEIFLKSFCILGTAFQKQCVPDLKRLVFLMKFTLDRLEAGISVDTQVFFNGLSLDLLGEIFAEALGIIDIIQDLGLNPLKCVQDEIVRLMKAAMDNTAQAQAGGLMMANAFGAGELNSTRANAARARTESAQRTVNNGMRTAMETVDKALGEFEDLLDLDRFSKYIEGGLGYFESFKNYLKQAINQIVGNNTDSFNKMFRFSNQKMDILKYVSIIKALIESAGKGGIKCGPDTSSMTQEEVISVINNFKFPDQDIELAVEDGNVIIRPANTVTVNNIPPESRPVSDPLSPGSTSDVPSFAVTTATRPIDSCLGKVSNTDADKVRKWIEQLAE